MGVASSLKSSWESASDESSEEKESQSGIDDGAVHDSRGPATEPKREEEAKSRIKDEPKKKKAIRRMNEAMGFCQEFLKEAFLTHHNSLCSSDLAILIHGETRTIDSEGTNDPRFKALSERLEFLNHFEHFQLTNAHRKERARSVAAPKIKNQKSVQPEEPNELREYRVPEEEEKKKESETPYFGYKASSKISWSQPPPEESQSKRETVDFGFMSAIGPNWDLNGVEKEKVRSQEKEFKKEREMKGERKTNEYQRDPKTEEIPRDSEKSQKRKENLNKETQKRQDAHELIQKELSLHQNQHQKSGFYGDSRENQIPPQRGVSHVTRVGENMQKRNNGVHFSSSQAPLSNSLSIPKAKKEIRSEVVPLKAENNEKEKKEPQIQQNQKSEVEVLKSHHCFDRRTLKKANEDSFKLLEQLFLSKASPKPKETQRSENSKESQMSEKLKETRRTEKPQFNPVYRSEVFEARLSQVSAVQTPEVEDKGSKFKGLSDSDRQNIKKHLRNLAQIKTLRESEENDEKLKDHHDHDLKLQEYPQASQPRQLNDKSHQKGKETKQNEHMGIKELGDSQSNEEEFLSSLEVGPSLDEEEDEKEIKIDRFLPKTKKVMRRPIESEEMLQAKKFSNEKVEVFEKAKKSKSPQRFFVKYGRGINQENLKSHFKQPKNASFEFVSNSKSTISQIDQGKSERNGGFHSEILKRKLSPRFQRANRSKEQKDQSRSKSTTRKPKPNPHLKALEAKFDKKLKESQLNSKIKENPKNMAKTQNNSALTMKSKLKTQEKKSESALTHQVHVEQKFFNIIKSDIDELSRKMGSELS